MHERPGKLRKLWEASKFVLLECISPPFCSAYSPAGSLLVPGFTISNINDINRFIERPKITSFAARLSHKQKVRTFFPFAIGVFSPKTAFKHYFGGLTFRNVKYGDNDNLAP